MLAIAIGENSGEKAVCTAHQWDRQTTKRRCEYHDFVCVMLANSFWPFDLVHSEKKGNKYPYVFPYVSVRTLGMNTWPGTYHTTGSLLKVSPRMDAVTNLICDIACTIREWNDKRIVRSYPHGPAQASTFRTFGDCSLT